MGHGGWLGSTIFCSLIRFKGNFSGAFDVKLQVGMGFFVGFFLNVGG